MPRKATNMLESREDKAYKYLNRIIMFTFLSVSGKNQMATFNIARMQKKY